MKTTLGMETQLSKCSFSHNRRAIIILFHFVKRLQDIWGCFTHCSVLSFIPAFVHGIKSVCLQRITLYINLDYFSLLYEDILLQ